MKALPNSLKLIRKERGLTLKQLAATAKVGLSTINNFENGATNASTDLLTKLAQALSVSVDDLLKPSGDEGNVGLPPKKNRFRLVPVVSWARAGAASDYADLCTQIDEWVQTDCQDPNAFALIIEGDSMEPDFRAGDRVVFAPNSEPRNGDFVVARLKENMGVLFKQFRRTGPEGRLIRLESLNINYTTQEHAVESFHFIYPVVGQFRKFLR